ncbi:MAG: GNAT family N-acetyltransferase [Bacteroidales bacterium]|nr:GNAT family N-acetyltransferase [Bacteroidales bacterium]
MIKILSRKQINDKKWDEVIAGSAFEMIYPYTWYLDRCADNWLGLVMNDYECIMPVVFRKKIGLKYTYQPLYCQQLGVFSRSQIDIEIVRMFLHRLAAVFKMGDFAFNAGNVIGEEKGVEVTDNTNYVLDLSIPYEKMHANYNENCRRNIRKAHKSEIAYSEEVDLKEIITLKKISETTMHSPAVHAFRKKLFSELAAQDKIRILGARTGDHLLAAAVFAYSSKRVFFLLSASSELGKEKRAMFLIVDQFIRDHAGERISLDFEGSNIVSIARFFRGFGAKPEIYQRISIHSTAGNIIKKIKRV